MISALPNSVRVQPPSGKMSRSRAQNAFRHRAARGPVDADADRSMRYVDDRVRASIVRVTGVVAEHEDIRPVRAKARCAVV